ncbi:MAPEG family protein [Sphingomonas koreensis]|nr:MAPEG family protein [Sphingomonas koreensis]
MPFGILWPTFALVALIFVVWVVLFVQRFAHIKRNPPSAADFADGDAAMRYFRPVEMPANNLANLFEMPVLFFALVPLLLITRHADHLQVLLAWVFVVLRCVHSVIHIGPKKVQPRFLVYLASCAVLLAMWIGFFVDMLHAASVYHAALGGAYPTR